MRASTRIGLAAALTTLVVLGSAAIAAAAPRAVSPARFAKAVCTSYLGLPKAFEEFTTAYNTAPTDPATFQSTVVTGATALVSSLKELQSSVKKLYPDVDDGKKITKLFVNDLQRYIDRVSSATSTFEAVDPNGVDFVGDQAELESAITVLASTNRSDPFSKVHDQDVLQSLDSEKSCAKVVTIYRR